MEYLIAIGFTALTVIAILEIILGLGYYEGRYSSVYDVSQGSPEYVLGDGCGL